MALTISIPKHVLDLGGNPDAEGRRRPYYALVCRCDTEVVLGDHGPFDPSQCLTLANDRLSLAAAGHTAPAGYCFIRRRRLRR